MTLNLTKWEARFLSTQLNNHIAHVQNELIHTDQRDLKRAIAQDLATLEMLRNRLANEVARATEERVS